VIEDFLGVLEASEASSDSPPQEDAIALRHLRAAAALLAEIEGPSDGRLDDICRRCEAVLRRASAGPAPSPSTW
jgi:hypothetical protein